jgi:PIN domain nuclease of toxin-antitoxin system
MHAAPERLSARTRRFVTDAENELLFSVASSWEIAIKYSTGKLVLPAAPAKYVPSRLADGEFVTLPITHSHALRVAALRRHHRDPFDRLLVAQCEVEGLPILTADRQFAAYGVKVMWA